MGDLPTLLPRPRLVDVSDPPRAGHWRCSPHYQRTHRSYPHRKFMMLDSFPGMRCINVAPAIPALSFISSNYELDMSILMHILPTDLPHGLDHAGLAHWIVVRRARLYCHSWRCTTISPGLLPLRHVYRKWPPLSHKFATTI